MKEYIASKLNYIKIPSNMNEFYIKIGLRKNGFDLDKPIMISEDFKTGDIIYRQYE